MPIRHFYPPVSKASREVANLTERKKSTSKNGEMGVFRPDLDRVFRLKSNF